MTLQEVTLQPEVPPFFQPVGQVAYTNPLVFHKCNEAWYAHGALVMLLETKIKNSKALRFDSYRKASIERVSICRWRIAGTYIDTNFQHKYYAEIFKDDKNKWVLVDYKLNF